MFHGVSLSHGMNFLKGECCRVLSKRPWEKLTAGNRKLPLPTSQTVPCQRPGWKLRVALRCIACCSMWSWNHARPQICHDGSVTVVCCWSRHSCLVGTGKWKRGTEGCPGQALFRGVIVPCWQSNLLSIGVSLTASMPLVLTRFERKRQNST